VPYQHRWGGGGGGGQGSGAISDRMKTAKWNRRRMHRKPRRMGMGEGMGGGNLDSGNSIPIPAQQWYTDNSPGAKLRPTFNIGRAFQRQQCPTRWSESSDALCPT